MSENTQSPGRGPEDKPSVQFPNLEGFEQKSAVQFPDLNGDDLLKKPESPQADASEREIVPVEEVSVEVPDLDEEAEEEYVRSRGAFFNWAQSKSDEQWKRIQIIGGLAAGLGASACIGLITPKEENSFLSWSFVAAMVIAMFLPNFVEKKSGRTISLARKLLLITLVVFMVGLVAYNLLTGGFSKAA